MAIKVNGTTVIDDTKKLVNVQSVTFNDSSVLSEAPATIKLTYEGFDSAYEFNLIDRIELSDRYAFDKNSLITTTSVFDTTKLIHTLDNPKPYGASTNYVFFGHSIAISGNYAFVGARDQAESGGGTSGKAYIFNVTTGALVHTIDNPNAYNTVAGDKFGYDLAVSGNYVIVSAYGEDDSSGNDSGKAYIFKTTDGTWTDTTLVYTLDNPNPYGTSSYDTFASVAIDGNYAVVGAYSEDDSSGNSSGKVYIYKTTDGTWTDTTLVHTLNNPNPYGTSLSDNFGYWVAISGNYAITGAYGEDDSGGNSSGKAYIFNVTTGALVHTLDDPNAYGTVANDNFGISVAISGNYAIVGANRESDSSAGGSDYSGKAYIFNVTTGALVHTLDNPNPYSTSADDRFGSYVAISGNYAIVGAYWEDDSGGGSGLNSGKAYIFNVTTGALVHTLNNPNAYSTPAIDQFGWRVSITGNYAIVGATNEDDSFGVSSGKVYIYYLDTDPVKPRTLLDKLIKIF